MRIAPIAAIREGSGTASLSIVAARSDPSSPPRSSPSLARWPPWSFPGGLPVASPVLFGSGALVLFIGVACASRWIAGPLAAVIEKPIEPFTRGADELADPHPRRVHHRPAGADRHTSQPVLRPARAVRDHQPARDRQHPGPVHHRTDSRDRRAARHRHDQNPATPDDPYRRRNHRPHRGGHRDRYRCPSRRAHRPHAFCLGRRVRGALELALAILLAWARSRPASSPASAPPAAPHTWIPSTHCPTNKETTCRTSAHPPQRPGQTQLTAVTPAAVQAVRPRLAAGAPRGPRLRADSDRNREEDGA